MTKRRDPLYFGRTDGVHSRTRKLAPADVLEIRAAIDGARNKRAAEHELAKRFGISRTNAACIGRRRSWQSLPERIFG